MRSTVFEMEGKCAVDQYLGGCGFCSQPTLLTKQRRPHGQWGQ